MLRLLATLIKEFKLLIVDKVGITVLFVMPILLVFIMTLIQHEAYKSLTQSGIPVLLVNKDNDSLGIAIEKGFRKFSMCELTVDRGETYTSSAAIKKQIIDGKFIIALVIPKGATNVLRENVGEMMTTFFDKEKSSEAVSKPVNIEILIDPTASKTFVIAISSGLKEFIAAIKTKILFEILGEKMAVLLDSKSKVKMPNSDFFVYNEDYAQREGSKKTYKPNAIQHNIPAWAIFSIFFMVLPLAGSIINERSEGLSIRLRTFPGSYLSILSGKLLVFFIVAIIQFTMIILLAEYVMPLIGLPKLDIGTHHLALVAMTITLSLSSISYGLLVGTLFNTTQQSAVFGGISILIMSAIGGIWVPVNIMPPVMQSISEISPLNWALTGYYELFIKGGGWDAIQFQLLKLGLFFIFCLLLSYVLFKFKTRLN